MLVGLLARHQFAIIQYGSKDHGGLGFSPNSITQEPASHFLL